MATKRENNIEKPADRIKSPQAGLLCTNGLAQPRKANATGQA